MKAKNLLIGAGAIIIVGGITAYLLFKNGLIPVRYTQENSQQNGQENPISGVGAYDEEGNLVRIDTAPTNDNLPPAPDMSGEIIFPSGYTAANKMMVIEKIESLRAAVKENPGDTNSWIDLGSYWKLIENYKKAETAWMYVAQINPTNPVPLGNLGFLYGYYVHDNVKAEQYYLQAIELAPDQEYLYFQLSDFYKDVLGSLPKAKNIVDRGVLANPKSTALKELRAYLDTL